MPVRVMVIVAHPDDAEFGCAGTVAKWVRQGKEVTYVICTNGDKGSSDPSMTSEQLAPIRRKEQEAAARLLGVKEVVFLGYPDGFLEDTPAFRGELVRLIRKYRPDVVLTTDPYRHYQPHRDHRIVGSVALDAVFPSARDRLSYPEHMAEGLDPHKVGEAYLYGSDNPDVWEDITETFDIKMAALKCHASQMKPDSGWQDRVKEWAEIAGAKADAPLAEAFKRLEFRR